MFISFPAVLPNILRRGGYGALDGATGAVVIEFIDKFTHGGKF